MTPEQRKQLEEIFSRGLTIGAGSATGQTCIEGALSLVFDGELGDQPSCVASPDRDWAIIINDAEWPSPGERAKALLPIALAQAGTAGTDRTAWVQSVALGTIQRVLPIALEAIGHVDAANACRESADLESAKTAARDAHAAASAASASASAYASDAYAADAASAAYAAAATTSASAYASAVSSARAARYAARAANSAEALEVEVAVALDAYAQQAQHAQQDTEEE